MDALHTPAGEIFLERDDGTRIPFTAERNPYCPAYGTLLPEETLLLTCAAEYFLPGHDHHLVLRTGKLRFCGADEDRQALYALQSGYAVGIGARDPNDGALLNNDRLLRHYILTPLRDGHGFNLNVLESLTQPVVFTAAWVKTGELPAQAYEDALALWLV